MNTYVYKKKNVGKITIRISFTSQTGGNILIYNTFTWSSLSPSTYHHLHTLFSLQILLLLEKYTSPANFKAQ